MRSVLCCLLLLITPFLSHADVDGNGIDELIVISIENDGSFLWQTLEEHQESATSIGTLGRIGDIPIPGVWSTPERSSIGIIHREKDGSLTWSIQNQDGTVQSISFGKAPARIITGADVDGSGYADAITVTTTNPSSSRNMLLQWHIRLDPFAPSAVSKDLHFSFGRRDNTLFFFSPDGIRDHLGVLSPTNVNARVYDAVTGEISAVPFPKIALKTDKIYPLHSSNGIDNLLIIRQLGYWIIDANGKKTIQGVLRNEGSIVIGNYNSSLSGEEIGVRSGRTGAVPILNPELRGATTFFPPDGLLVAETATSYIGSYRPAPAVTYNYQCSRIEDTTTRTGREFKTITNSKGELFVQTRRLFLRLEVEAADGTTYPLAFWKSDGKKGGIWRGNGFSLASVMPLGRIVGTINDERTCWNY